MIIIKIIFIAIIMISSLNLFRKKQINIYQ